MSMLRVLDIRSVSCNGHDRGKSEGRTFGNVDRMRQSFRGGLAFFSFSFVNRYGERVATLTNAFVFAARYKMLPAQQMLLICLCGKWSGSMLCVCLLLVTWSWSHVPAVHTLQHDYTSVRCALPPLSACQTGLHLWVTSHLLNCMSRAVCFCVSSVKHSQYRRWRPCAFPCTGTNVHSLAVLFFPNVNLMPHSDTFILSTDIFERKK